jgi:hypothetical protein
MPHLVKAATRGETEKVAVHETGAGFPASRSLVCLKLDGQQQAALRGARGAVEAVEPDVVINFHVPLVQLTLQEALNPLKEKEGGIDILETADV